MTFDAPTLVALATLITAIVSGFIAIATFFNSVRNGRKIDEGTAATHEGNAVAKRIEIHTNGMQEKLENAAFIAGGQAEKEKQP